MERKREKRKRKNIDFMERKREKRQRARKRAKYKNDICQKNEKIYLERERKSFAFAGICSQS